MIINLARRAHDHNWELDPITRSLLDTDFYKLLMLQFIWKQFPKTQTSFAFMNRSVEVRLGDLIDLDQLREQLEQTKKLRFHKSELIWLAGNTFYGRRGIFEPAFLEWLEGDFRLPETESLAAFNALQQYVPVVHPFLQRRSPPRGCACGCRRSVASRLVMFPDEIHLVLNPNNRRVPRRRFS